MNPTSDNEPAAPTRQHPAHPPPVERFNEPTILFVTVCVLDRSPILANDSVLEALRCIWPKADHWRVGSYLIMPDHLHLFCVPGVHEPLSIKRWAEYWKHMLSRALPALSGTLQRDCWDTQMRSREHYEEKLAYMRMNPVRAGLVERPEDWPYRGTLNEIRW